MTSKRKNPCTNWFPGSVKPVREGPYKRMYPGEGVMFCWFDKKAQKFGLASGTPEDAKEWCIKHGYSGYQNLAWCGLANDPEKNK